MLTCPRLCSRRLSPTAQTEPYEHVVIDVDEVHSGMVIERMAGRKGNMEEFHQMGPGKVRDGALPG
jgi:GTP-binding protein